MAWFYPTFRNRSKEDVLREARVRFSPVAQSASLEFGRDGFEQEQYSAHYPNRVLFAVFGHRGIYILRYRGTHRDQHNSGSSE